MAQMIVDARGLSCPEPVLLTKKAVDKNSGEIKILVDNPTAFNNVQRFLKKAGKTFEARSVGEEYEIAVK